MTPFQRLDPDLVGPMSAIPAADLTDEVVAVLRSFEIPGISSDHVDRSEHVVPGEPEIRLRIHRPPGSSDNLPCLYSMHGGGYVIGSATLDDEMFERLCPLLGLVGVSVEYRLAPDTPYPGPLDDCYRGLRWTHEHADELGIDRGRIGVGGASAGGGLAAALALLARDRGEVPILFQLLESPMLDDRQITPSSRQDDLPVWSRVSNAYGWRSYLGELYGTERVPPTAAPARAEHLADLPAAFVSVGTVDGFLDEDVDYAMRLNHAGVPTELHVYPGACHGYQLATDHEITVRSRCDVAAWLARQIHGTR